MSPLYEYRCNAHGIFEEIGCYYKKHAFCPVCSEPSERIFSIPCRPRVNYGESLPLGNKSRGRFIPPEGNRAGILVPSFGALEKEEVDYIAEASLEKEKTRVRQSEQKETLEKVTQALLSTPKGQRHAKLNEIQGR